MTDHSDLQSTRKIVRMAKKMGASGVNVTHPNGRSVQIFLPTFLQTFINQDSREGSGGNRSPNTSTAQPAVEGYLVNRLSAQTPKARVRAQSHKALKKELARLRSPFTPSTPALGAEIALASTPPVAEPSPAQVSTPIVAKPLILEPPETPEQLVRNEMLHQLATFGFDASVNELMLDEAKGDVDEAAVLLLAAKAREEKRAEAERQQEARGMEVEAAADARANAIAAKLLRQAAAKTAKAEKAKAKAASDKEAKAKAAAAKSAPAPAPAPPSSSSTTANPTPPSLDELLTQKHTGPKMMRVPVSGKPKPPMPKPSGSTTEARATAPPRQPKKPPDGKDSGSCAAT
jgi:hypothetical protein